MNINLDKKHCPFCGSKDVSSVIMPGLTWIVGCNNCGCRTKEFVSAFEALTAWNRHTDHCDNYSLLEPEPEPEYPMTQTPPMIPICSQEEIPLAMTEKLKPARIAAGKLNC